jgi:hypothetical protein
MEKESYGVPYSDYRALQHERLSEVPFIPKAVGQDGNRLLLEKVDGVEWKRLIHDPSVTLSTHIEIALATVWQVMHVWNNYEIMLNDRNDRNVMVVPSARRFVDVRQVDLDQVTIPGGGSFSDEELEDRIVRRVARNVMTAKEGAKLKSRLLERMARDGGPKLYKLEEIKSELEKMDGRLRKRPELGLRTRWWDNEELRVREMSYEL